MTNLDKILNIYKPKGPTSHDIVDLVRNHFPQKKVGHGGTLDPLARGVLIVGIGRATKQLGQISKADKSYRAKVVLGLSSPTDDLGKKDKLKIDKNRPLISEKELKECLKNFEGKIEQRVPLFSATHYQGERLYKRARRGEKISFHQLPQKKITIDKIKLLDFKKQGFSWQNKKLPKVELKITCSSGTYIRSLARDLGLKLKTKALLSELIRTRVGKYRLKNSIKIKDLENIKNKE